MLVWTSLFLILHIIVTSSEASAISALQNIITNLFNKIRCDVHDLTDTYTHEMETSPYKNRTVEQITASWQSTFPTGNYRTNTKNLISYNQMALRDPDTILRMAEYQAMVYCKSNIVNSPSDVSAIINMAKKNLRVGNFTIKATGFDENQVLFWYIAVNIPQQSIILVHRGTSKSNSDDVYDDIVKLKIDNSNGLLSLDFPYLTKSNDVSVDIGFYQRFQHEKLAIVNALRQVLTQYSTPSYSFIVVGHSLGAAWAFLNAGYFANLTDINKRMTAIYTFGQPLLGSELLVNTITTKLDTPVQRYVRIVNRNDLIPHIGCDNCVQPEYSNEKWIVNTNSVIWKDCQGGQDLTCSSGIPCSQLSWANHSAVGYFSMRGEFCRIASNT